MSKPTFLTLPAELRLQIISYLLPQPPESGFLQLNSPNAALGLILDAAYSSSQHISLLLTCRQFYADFTPLAFSSTTFLIIDTFTPILQRFFTLQAHQRQALRKLAFVAGARQFREMCQWEKWPFDMASLALDELTIVLHRSAHWHYPSDFTSDIVSLLRRLRQVRKLKFVRNGANVKGFFKTWYNRLVGLMLKEDHRQRYDVPGGPYLEDTWWEWGYDENEQSFELRAVERKPVLEEGEYMEWVKPRVQRLVRDMEDEEEDPDPRARNGWP
ncbi:hypothetical protein P154DRAFT_111047 [Amniculicola lignicola CBS 123094]|uniref:F-box domain-containing protein n=1 Tax=Amniculicola lignicola CBS 123094 TaxID=1392246 RepID=A0A6A5X002_9PLEO|nr:hypothetical protein P154DRAFT_111047 [Amniculicola lignicola CBS 123094]